MLKHRLDKCLALCYWRALLIFHLICLKSEHVPKGRRTSKTATCGSAETWVTPRGADRAAEPTVKAPYYLLCSLHRGVGGHGGYIDANRSKKSSAWRRSTSAPGQRGRTRPCCCQRYAVRWTHVRSLGESVTSACLPPRLRGRTRLYSCGYLRHTTRRSFRVNTLVWHPPRHCCVPPPLQLRKGLQQQ